MHVIGAEEISEKLARLGNPRPSQAQPKGDKTRRNWAYGTAIAALGALLGAGATVALTSQPSHARLSPTAVDWIVLEIAQARDITPNTARRLLEMQNQQ